MKTCLSCSSEIFNKAKYCFDCRVKRKKLARLKYYSQHPPKKGEYSYQCKICQINIGTLRRKFCEFHAHEGYAKEAAEIRNAKKLHVKKSKQKIIPNYTTETYEIIEEL